MRSLESPYPEETSTEKVSEVGEKINVCCCIILPFPMIFVKYDNFK